MLPIGVPVYVDFRIVDAASAPVTGRTLSNFAIVFLRDGVACSDALTLLEYGAGRYAVRYTPSSKGHDYLELYDGVNDDRVAYAEDIVDLFGTSASTAILTQDYGGADALRVTVENPQTFTLLVYRSSDWIAGRNDFYSAVGQSTLDANGRWNSPILVTSGTYHVVARHFGTVVVVRANLGV